MQYAIRDRIYRQIRKQMFDDLRNNIQYKIILDYITDWDSKSVIITFSDKNNAVLCAEIIVHINGVYADASKLNSIKRYDTMQIELCNAILYDKTGRRID